MGYDGYFVLLLIKVGLKRGLRRILINGHFFNKIYKTIYQNYTNRPILMNFHNPYVYARVPVKFSEKPSCENKAKHFCQNYT